MDESEQKVCKNIHRYILFDLNKYEDIKIFHKNSMEELGQYFFEKIIRNVPSATDTLIKIVIKAISKKSSFDSDKEYYIGLCTILDIENLPRKVYCKVKREYIRIFKQYYKKVGMQIDNRVLLIDSEVDSISISTEKIIEKSNRCKSFLKDLKASEDELYSLCSKFNALRTEKEMLLFSKKYMTDCLSSFCVLDDKSDVLSTLRKKSIMLSKKEAYNIESEFSYYNDIVSITESHIQNDYIIFFKVKLYQLADEIYENAYKSFDDNRTHQFKEQMDRLPRIESLQKLKCENSLDYRNKLENIISKHKIIDNLIEKVNASVCLRNRKDILLKTLEIFKEEQFDLFNNILPIQLEGLFADYLNDTTIFNRFSNLNLSLNADLRGKIQSLQDLGADIYPETILYFNYYFNNRVRNVIAHGNYKNIYSDENQSSIFALELLLDLNFLTHMLLRKSETEKMYRFVHGYKAYYEKIIKGPNPHFGALFNDLNRNRIHSDYDSMENYRPIQIIYWLINPYYENIYEQIASKVELIELRNDLLSVDFWTYILNKLKEVQKEGFDYLHLDREFTSVVKGIFLCNLSNELKTILGQVNAILEQISNFSDLN
jgi:hypothetical protein